METAIGHCGCMEHAGFLEGNWPDACRSEITVSYSIDQIDTALFERALRRALRFWEEALDVGFAILPQFTKEARIWITDAPLPGSTLAWSFLANNSCGASLEQRYDTLVNWSEDYLTATIVHEVGHALGLTHSNSREDIMYPSITMNTIQPSGGDVRRAVALGYRRRTEPLPPAPPTPPPPQPPVPEEPRMDWYEILTIVLELLKNCQAKHGQERATAVLLGRGPLAKWTLRSELRQHGYRGPALREALSAAMEQLREASDEELRELLVDAATDLATVTS